MLTKKGEEGNVEREREEITDRIEVERGRRQVSFSTVRDSSLLIGGFFTMELLMDNSKFNNF